MIILLSVLRESDLSLSTSLLCKPQTYTECNCSRRFSLSYSAAGPPASNHPATANHHGCCSFSYLYLSFLSFLPLYDMMERKLAPEIGARFLETGVSLCRQFQARVSWI